MWKWLFRYNLIWVLFLAIVLVPGILTLLKSHSGSPHLTWLAKLDVPLNGMTAPIEKPAFNLSHLRKHEVQKYLEDHLTTQLPMRNWLIQLNNQLNYVLLKKSYNMNGQLIITRSHQLFELGYITAYCDLENKIIEKRAELSRWADEVKALRDYFESQGKTFVYLITPTKAEYMPEEIPKRYHCKRVGNNVLIQDMENYLTERNVPWLNTADLMKPATEHYGIPMFPLGGTHWNYLGATIATNAIIKAINADHHLHLDPIQFHYEITDQPQGSDTDLMSLLNLMKPDFSYQVPKLTYLPKNHSVKPLTVAFIGGSFCGQLIDIMMQSKTVSKIDYYRYFKLDRSTYEYGKEPLIQSVDLSSRKTLAPILSADVVILEENAAVIGSKHGKLFYDEMKKQIA